MSTASRALLASFFFALSASVCALDDGKDDEDYQIPDGYEERRYSLQTLLRSATDFTMGNPCSRSSAIPELTGQNILDIIRTCVAPDSWTKRGSARMELSEPVLSIIQKKEVHTEIERVLQWLNDGATPPFRATVIAVNLKTVTVRKFAAGAAITPADFAKALEEAGETGVDIVELRGVERQTVVATSAFTQNFIKDYDVSGAVFDPVVSTTGTGFSASAVVYRNPDCASLQIDLSVKLLDKIEMAKGKILGEGGMAAKSPTEVKTLIKDDQGKDKVESARIPHDGKPVNIKADLNLDLPSQVGGGLQTSFSAPQGAFVLAGTIDLSAPNNTPGMLTAIFVRASAGHGTLPALAGVSGLKEGESFRLYPAAANLRHTPSFPGNMPDMFSKFLELGTSESVANPFAQAPAGAGAPTALDVRGLKDSISKSQKLLAEKVRKNKLVEAMGPVVFTRLVEADHTRFLANLMTEMRFYSTPVSVHAFALVLPPAAYRKLMLEDHELYEAAEVEALNANGAMLLADASLKMVPGGNFANIFAGRKRSVISDYEISGDSHDPVIRQLPEQAFAIDFVCRRGAQANGDEIEVRFNAVPDKLLVTRETLETFSVNSGGSMDVLLNLRADLDKVRNGALGFRSAARGATGKYALAGSAQMPNTADGKRDPRQAVLFVRVTDEK